MCCVQLQVPNDQVGSIIGGQGSNINRIRQTSGARIKVMAACEHTQNQLLSPLL